MTKEENQRRANDPEIIELKSRIVSYKDKKPFVFISYKSDDWEIVLKDIVYRLVFEHGLNVYFDGDFDNHAENWTTQFPKNMESQYCKGMIIFVDNKYATSYATLLELMRSQTRKATNGSINHGREDCGLPVVQINLEELNNKIDLDASTFLGEERDDDGNLNVNSKTEKELFGNTIILITNAGKFKGTYTSLFKQYYDLQALDEKKPLLTRGECHEMVTEILKKLKLNEKQYTPGDKLESICATIRNAVMRSSDDAENNVFSGEISKDVHPTAEPVPASVPAPVSVDVPASVVPEPAPSAVPAEHAPTSSIKPRGLFSGKVPSSPAMPQASDPDASDQNSNDNSTIATGTYHIKGGTYSAYCRVENGKYTVLAGSTVNSSSTASAAHRWLYQKYADIISGNKLTEDVQFQSSSAAACFIKGNSASGPATFRGLAPLDAVAVPEAGSTQPVTETESNNAAADNDNGIADGIYHITNKNNEYNAYCECMGSSFRVLPGSRIKYATEKYKASLKGKYDTLTANVHEGVVTESVSFTSPSGAACFIVGNSVNGKKLFIEQNLLTGKELEEYLKKRN